MSQWNAQPDMMNALAGQHMVHSGPSIPGVSIKAPSSQVTTPRPPGVMPPVRLTQAARQEYEEYMRSRLAIGPSGSRGMAPPAPMIGPPPIGHPTITQVSMFIYCP